MKYLMIVVAAVALMNCGDNIINGSGEYKELEVDMEEFCFGQPSGVYYFGPKEGYNVVSIKRVVKHDGYINEKQSVGYLQGEGFEFWCPDENTYIITWN